jgi:signal transduction histidine kinase
MERRTVSRPINSRVRRSAQPVSSAPVRRMQPKSGPLCASFLLQPGDAHQLSEVGVPAGAIESQRASGVGKPRKPEYSSQRLNDLAERAQLRHQTQRQCLGDISHELRAPISRIRVLLERARRTPQEIYSYLARIEDNVLRMEALTGRLLDFSRLEFAEESLAKEQCDLAALVCRVVEDARIEAEARGCTIKLLPAPTCPVSANYELLHRAVENVVRNSIQYTRENSLVSVVLSCLSNGFAQILVEDEGPGISEEELEEVFRPFHRAAHARISQKLGVGLGLAISERAVKLHGGSVKASNRSDGKGLQVAIQIPLLNKSHLSARQFLPTVVPAIVATSS